MRLILPFLLLTANATSAEFRLGSAFNGAWYDPEHAGQGMSVQSSAEGDFFFGAWFTYPADSEGSADAHRWWTVEGPWSGPASNLTIYRTTGGAFLSPQPVLSEPIGTAHIELVDCQQLTMSFDFDHGEAGEVTMQRLLPVPAGHCDPLRVIQSPETELSAETPMVFRDVTVVGMVPGQPFESEAPRSVLVQDGVIQAVARFSELAIPPGAVVIDGRGRYLLPGVVDTHTHLAVNISELQGFADPAELEQVAANQLDLYLANGVTTLLNLGDFGEPTPRWAAEIESGQRRGPTLYSAKYARGGLTSCDGGPPAVVVGSSEAAGRQYVRDADAQGYDFIKVYNCTPRAALDGILAEAPVLGMPIAGHFPGRNPTEDLLRGPAFSLLAHSNAFLWNGYLGIGSPGGDRDDAVALMLEGSTALSTTLWIVEEIARYWCRGRGGFNEWLATAPIEYMHLTEVRLHERSLTSGRFGPPGCQPGAFDHDLDFARDMVRKVQLAGGELTTGTDSPTVLGVAGFSMHDELAALLRAGLDVQQALAAATRLPGVYLGRVLTLPAPFGQVAPGHRADLLLLDRPPADAVLDFPAALDLVMARGHLYPRVVRNAWLADIRAQYSGHCPPYCKP